MHALLELHLAGLHSWPHPCGEDPPHVQILTSLVSLCLLGIIGLSATPILRSKENYWTAFESNGQQPAFSFGYAQRFQEKWLHQLWHGRLSSCPSALACICPCTFLSMHMHLGLHKSFLFCSPVAEEGQATCCGLSQHMHLLLHLLSWVVLCSGGWLSYHQSGMEGAKDLRVSHQAFVNWAPLSVVVGQRLYVKSLQASVTFAEVIRSIPD